MFHATFGGRTVYSVQGERDQLLRLGLPIPREFERANSVFNPLGSSPAKGWLLMLRRDLAAMNLNSLHDLVFDLDGTRLTFKNLVVSADPLNLYPSSQANNPDSLYLVEVADARHRVHNSYFQVPISKQYNVRAYAYLGAGGATEYLADSLNAGSLWTWETMTQDIWGLMSQLGSAPSLPVTPHGSPEGFVFQGCSAWEALTQVLERIGCAVKADLTTGTYSIVQVGAADAAADAILEALTPIHDGEFLTVARARVPYGVRVYFHRQEQYPGLEQTTPRTSANWQTSSVYSVDITDADANAEPGTYAPLWDDLPAIYDASGALTNESALNDRAQERADDFYRRLRGSDSSTLWRIYSGLVAIQPGSNIKGVSWREGEGGVTTEVSRHPVAMFRAEAGRWIQTQTRLQPPALRPAWPAQQTQREQVIEIANGTPSSGRYDATVEIRSSGAGTWLDKESVYALDLGGATSLTAGDRYKGLLVGYEGSRPLFAIDTRGTLSFAVGTTGTDFNVAVSGGTVTYHLPDASTTARGAVTTGAQTWAGGKTFQTVAAGGADAPAVKLTQSGMFDSIFEVSTTSTLITRIDFNGQLRTVAGIIAEPTISSPGADSYSRSSFFNQQYPAKSVDWCGVVSSEFDAGNFGTALYVEGAGDRAILGGINFVSGNNKSFAVQDSAGDIHDGVYGTLLDGTVVKGGLITDIAESVEYVTTTGTTAATGIGNNTISGPFQTS